MRGRLMVPALGKLRWRASIIGEVPTPAQTFILERKIASNLAVPSRLTGPPRLDDAHPLPLIWVPI